MWRWGTTSDWDRGRAFKEFHIWQLVRGRGQHVRNERHTCWEHPGLQIAEPPAACVGIGKVGGKEVRHPTSMSGFWFKTRAHKSGISTCRYVVTYRNVGTGARSCASDQQLKSIPRFHIRISVVHLTLDGVNGKWRWRGNLCQIDGEIVNYAVNRQSLVTVTPLFTIVIYGAIFEWRRMCTTLIRMHSRGKTVLVGLLRVQEVDIPACQRYTSLPNICQCYFSLPNICQCYFSLPNICQC